LLFGKRGFDKGASKPDYSTLFLALESMPCCEFSTGSPLGYSQGIEQRIGNSFVNTDVSNKAGVTQYSIHFRAGVFVNNVRMDFVPDWIVRRP